jgi:Protein of unknown function (DUF4238)
MGQSCIAGGEKLKKQSEPKRHHFVAKMHQRNFTDNGELFVFLKQNPQAGILARIPDAIFRKNYFHAIVNEKGEKDVSLEKDLANLEGKIKPVIDKLIHAARSGDVSDLTRADIDNWLLYFYLQGQRTPDFWDDIQKRDPNSIPEIIAEAKQENPNRSDEIDALFPQDQHDREFNNARIHVISRPEPYVLNVLKSRGIAIAKIAVSGKSFVLGSNPVVRMGSNDLRGITTELWLPIAPDIVMGLGLGDDKILLVNISDVAAIRRMNVSIANQSSSFASPSRDLIKSLANALGHNIQ